MALYDAACGVVHPFLNQSARFQLPRTAPHSSADRIGTRLVRGAAGAVRGIPPMRARRPLGLLQLRIFKDAGSHLSHRVEQAARLQRLAVLRL